MISSIKEHAGYKYLIRLSINGVIGWIELYTRCEIEEIPPNEVCAFVCVCVHMCILKESLHKRLV